MIDASAYKLGMDEYDPILGAQFIQLGYMPQNYKLMVPRKREYWMFFQYNTNLYTMEQVDIWKWEGRATRQLVQTIFKNQMIEGKFQVSIPGEIFKERLCRTTLVVTFSNNVSKEDVVTMEIPRMYLHYDGGGKVKYHLSEYYNAFNEGTHSSVIFDAQHLVKIVVTAPAGNMLVPLLPIPATVPQPVVPPQQAPAPLQPQRPAVAPQQVATPLLKRARDSFMASCSSSTTTTNSQVNFLYKKRRISQEEEKDLANSFSAVPLNVCNSTGSLSLLEGNEEAFYLPKELCWSSSSMLVKLEVDKPLEIKEECASPNTSYLRLCCEEFGMLPPYPSKKQHNQF